MQLAVTHLAEQKPVQVHGIQLQRDISANQLSEVNPAPALSRPSLAPTPGAPRSGPPARRAAAGTPGCRNASSWLGRRWEHGPRRRRLGLGSEPRGEGAAAGPAVRSPPCPQVRPAPWSPPRSDWAARVRREGGEARLPSTPHSQSAPQAGLRVLRGARDGVQDRR